MTIHQQPPASHDISAALSQLAGAELQALALVCTVGEGPAASVAAYITPNAASSAMFQHAIEMEGSYSDTLLSFDDNEPPYYGSDDRQIDLCLAADRLGVDRVLCVVMLDAAGKVAVTRDYDGLEVTLLEAANIQFNRFTDLLDGVMKIPTRTVQ